MRILGTQWEDGYLDESLLPGCVRLDIGFKVNIASIRGAHFIRRPSLRSLVARLGRIGPVALLQKISSRSKEKLRNEKMLSIGWAQVIESRSIDPSLVDEWVVFIAPVGPKCAERLVLFHELVRVIPKQPDIDEETLVHMDAVDRLGHRPSEFDSLMGWTHLSGAPTPSTLPMLLDRAHQTCLQLNRVRSGRKVLPKGSEIKESTDCDRRGQNDKPSGTLVGYGNYAKTIIIPCVRKWISVTRIHEVDPTQIGRPPSTPRGPAWDTCPHLREGEADVVFAAGFHHTHADIAIDALGRGAAAVIEKPIVTSERQLKNLVSAISKARSPAFACFHKRYSPFTRHIPTDLDLAGGDGAVHVQANVFEEPLPPLHWYRWQISGSRIMSNGCHWIDYFLFVNQFSDVEKQGVTILGEDLLITLQLSNGASLNLHITHEGSARLGVRDVVILRSGDRTITVEDGIRYRAESTSRILRKARAHGLASYRNMYKTIAKTVRSGGSGDTIKSIQNSAQAVLSLEQEFQSLGI